MISLEEKIFNIPLTGSFNQVALEVFEFQYFNNPIYRSYVDFLERKSITSVEDIPFLPIEFFKNQRIVTGNGATQVLFKSSGTTGMNRSEHHLTDTSMYERSFTATYNKFIGEPSKQVILALLPSYLEQGESSLVYMVDHLIKLTNSDVSGFILNDTNALMERYTLALNQGKQVVIFGVSYALLDLAEKNSDLSKAVIIETGGMKGRRAEMTKEQLHHIISQGTGVSHVSSEYGMTELLSQAYSDRNGQFSLPSWMKIIIRDINDPFTFVESGKSGGINVIDLANLYSCSFIATQDLGKIVGDQFTVLGRFDHTDSRGCNLMIE
jgi:phenylacetate-coenzyme A ligase PaaK-like adenylate-forming protein